MNVRAKFNGGKQINRSQSGSWLGGCAEEGLKMKEGSTWGTYCLGENCIHSFYDFYNGGRVEITQIN